MKRRVQVFQDCTNIGMPLQDGAKFSIDNQQSLSIFNIPTLTISPADSNPASLSRVSSQSDRRLKRYRMTEVALTATLQHCQEEIPDQELQIRSLRHLTAALAARADDSRVEAKRLSKALLDRNTDPTVYNSMQRQRWMDEKRVIAADAERQAVLKQLSYLTTCTNHHVTSVETDSRTSTKRNLLKFFEISKSQTPVYTCRHPSHPKSHSSHGVLFSGFKVHHRRRNLLPLSILQKPHTRPRQMLWEIPPTIQVQAGVPNSITCRPLEEECGQASGTATIFLPLKVNQDIIPDIQVTIPDYVEDLLEQFNLDYKLEMPGSLLHSSTLTVLSPTLLSPPPTPLDYLSSMKLPQSEFAQVHGPPSRSRLSTFVHYLRH